MSFNAVISWPTSSLPPASIWLLRSPALTCCATATACLSGREIERVSHQAMALPSTREKMLSSDMAHFDRP